MTVFPSHSTTYWPLAAETTDTVIKIVMLSDRLLGLSVMTSMVSK